MHIMGGIHCWWVEHNVAGGEIGPSHRPPLNMAYEYRPSVPACGDALTTSTFREAWIMPRFLSPHFSQLTTSTWQMIQSKKKMPSLLLGTLSPHAHDKLKERHYRS
jgi:hypothetical protein